MADDKTAKLRKWFSAYKRFFDFTFDEKTTEQIEVYNEMATLLGQPTFTKAKYEYQKVLDPKTGQYVMKEVKTN